MFPSTKLFLHLIFWKGSHKLELATLNFCLLWLQPAALYRTPRSKLGSFPPAGPSPTCVAYKSLSRLARLATGLPFNEFHRARTCFFTQMSAR